MENLWIVLCIAGVVLAAACGLRMLIMTIQDSPIIGLGAFVFPVFGLLYAMVNFSRYKGVLIGYVFSMALIVAGVVTMPKTARDSLASDTGDKKKIDLAGDPEPKEPKEPKEQKNPKIGTRGKDADRQPEDAQHGLGRERPVAGGGSIPGDPRPTKGGKRPPADPRPVPSDPSAVATLTVPELIEMLKDKSKDVKTRAIFELGKRGADAAAAVPVLTELLDDPNVGTTAKFALKKIENP